MPPLPYYGYAILHATAFFIFYAYVFAAAVDGATLMR